MPAKKESEKAPQEEVQATEDQSELEQISPEKQTVPEQLPPPAGKTLSPSQEQNWAMVAHLSILLNLFTGFLGPVVAVIIYLVYKDRSRYVAYQSLQATIFQLITWVGVGLLIGAIWLVTAFLSVFLIGLLCIPFSLLGTVLFLFMPLASLVYGVYAAVKCSSGEDFRYWLIGDWVRPTYENG